MQANLAGIASDSTKTESEKVAELSKEFEAMLVKQVIKGMQQSLGGSSLFPSKGPSAIYGDMMMDSLAHTISASNQVDFATMFQHQVSNQPVAPSAVDDTSVTEEDA
jgi:Rod binding domain-containing protein